MFDSFGLSGAAEPFPAPRCTIRFELSLTHISLGRGDGLSEFVALDEGHEDGPAFPQGLPAGVAVGLAGKETTQLGDPAQKGSVSLKAFGWPLKLGREDLAGRRWRVRWGGAVASSS